MKTNRDEIPWAPAFPFDQVLSLPFPDPLLGDGLSSKHLAAQLVVLLLHRDLVPHTSHLQLQHYVEKKQFNCLKFDAKYVQGN